MYGIGSKGTAGGASKPSLVTGGAKIKQRKGAIQSAAKFEPREFRDDLLEALQAVPAGDFDGFSKKLDELGNTLDYRRYEEELFQLLLVGRLIAPGGTSIADEAPACPFSLLASADKVPADLNQVKQVVEVFNKMMRRYKYLQKDFEGSSLPNILQHVNKYDTPSVPSTPGAATPMTKTSSQNPDVANLAVSSAAPTRPTTPTAAVANMPFPTEPRPSQDKLAMATALFVTQGLASPAVLASIKKEHLLKDGSALAFLVVYFKTFLTLENGNIEALYTSLRKGKTTDLAEFFPLNKRNLPDIIAFFKSHKLDAIADRFAKQKSLDVSKVTLAHLKEMVQGTESNEDIVAYLKEQDKLKAVPEVDFLNLIWTGLVSGVALADVTPQQATDNLIKEIKELSNVLEPFCTNARAEISLINTIQVWIYEHPQCTAAFVRILLLLFNADVLSSDAILYWYSKGSKPQGRQNFIKAAEPLVKKLQEQEEEDDDEDDE